MLNPHVCCRNPILGISTWPWNTFHGCHGLHSTPWAARQRVRSAAARRRGHCPVGLRPKLAARRLGEREREDIYMCVCVKDVDIMKIHVYVYVYVCVCTPNHPYDVWVCLKTRAVPPIHIWLQICGYPILRQTPCWIFFRHIWRKRNWTHGDINAGYIDVLMYRCLYVSTSVYQQAYCFYQLMAAWGINLNLGMQAMTGTYLNQRGKRFPEGTIVPNRLENKQDCSLMFYQNISVYT